MIPVPTVICSSGFKNTAKNLQLKSWCVKMSVPFSYRISKKLCFENSDELELVVDGFRFILSIVRIFSELAQINST